MEDTDRIDGGSQGSKDRHAETRDASNDDMALLSNTADPPKEAMNAVRLDEETTEESPDVTEERQVDSSTGKVMDETDTAKKDAMPPFPKDLLDKSVVHLIEKANGSAGRLVNLLAKHFPSFRDETRFDGRKVRLMKRAQIFVADLWAATNGRDYGAFEDIDHLTMFAGKSEVVILKPRTSALLFFRGARS